MLRAAAGARQRQREAQDDEAARGAGKRVARRADERAEHQHRAQAEPAGERGGRHLQPGQRADVERAQQRQGDVAEAELRLPDREEHVDQVGVAVVERMVDPDHRERAPGLRAAGGRSGEVWGSEAWGSEAWSGRDPAVGVHGRQDAALAVSRQTP